MIRCCAGQEKADSANRELQTNQGHFQAARIAFQLPWGDTGHGGGHRLGEGEQDEAKTRPTATSP